MLQQTSHYFLDYQIRGHMSCCCFELDLNKKCITIIIEDERPRYGSFVLKKKN